MTQIGWIKYTLEYLGGAQDEPPPGLSAGLADSWFWGGWWGILIIVIFVFSGQSSKFIYIDF